MTRCSTSVNIDNQRTCKRHARCVSRQPVSLDRHSTGTHLVPDALDIKLPFLRLSMGPLNFSYPLNKRVRTPVPRVEFLNSLW